MARYATLEKVRLALRVPDDAAALSWQDETWTATLTTALDAAESMIDEHCDRAFDETTESRDFAVEDPVWLDVGDWQTISGVTAGGVAVAADAFSAAVPASRGRPASGLLRTDGQAWPAGGTVTVAGTWGWAEVPAPVEHATIMTAARLFKRLDSPLGLTTIAGEGAYVSRVDRDVAQLLAPFCRPTIHVARARVFT